MSTLKFVKWNSMLGNPVTSFCIRENFFRVKLIFLSIFAQFFENKTKNCRNRKNTRKITKSVWRGKHTKTSRLATLDRIKKIVSRIVRILTSSINPYHKFKIFMKKTYSIWISNFSNRKWKLFKWLDLQQKKKTHHSILLL